MTLFLYDFTWAIHEQFGQTKGSRKEGEDKPPPVNVPPRFIVQIEKYEEYHKVHLWYFFDE